MMNEEKIDYKKKYEYEKKEREKLEHDYCILKEDTEKVKSKLKEIEEKSRKNIEVYQKACTENEELKRQLIKKVEENETYKKGIEKLIYTLGK